MHFSGNPFEYFFLDEFFDRQYHKDKQFGNVFGIFAFLALFIAGLGLFALTSYSTLKRTREIGVRKVMGASVKNIIYLLTGNFLRLIALAVLITVPLTIYFMNKWLQNFVYRTSINVWIFVLAGLIVALISTLTMIWHIYRAASTNPADALKYE